MRKVEGNPSSPGVGPCFQFLVQSKARPYLMKGTEFNVGRNQMVLPSSVLKTADLLLVFPGKTSSSEDRQLTVSCVLMNLW